MLTKINIEDMSYENVDVKNYTSDNIADLDSDFRDFTTVHSATYLTRVYNFVLNDEKYSFAYSVQYIALYKGDLSIFKIFASTNSFGKPLSAFSQCHFDQLRNEYDFEIYDIFKSLPQYQQFILENSVAGQEKEEVPTKKKRRM